ncbi:hypothetical protein COU77_02085 [Candidatus Peregrinibacteria bacterium CG10_big_fil_rev_8_21_14_0_10_49_16]|nr:MAG: hypothetical protein COU77_02085 [Candidatus Peregrinibacteria bacterium CG10_big_fil_rev_8_21_14_0_10_49_16]
MYTYFSRLRTYPLTWLIFIIAIVCLAAQVVHFGEHVAQVFSWIAVQQQKAYMTPFGMWCMHQVGMLLFPHADPVRQAYLGFEFLHLIGNGIFLIGIIALRYFVRSRKVVWALFIETFHLYEHISLSLSALFIGKSIGLSTFFGLQISPWVNLSYRVWWHFLFNLIPSVLIAMVVYEVWKCRSEK